MITLFYRKPVVLAACLLLVVAAGVAAIVQLPRQEDPRMTLRFAAVVTHLPGAGAEHVEALVSQPIEDELRTIRELKSISSVSRMGVSVVAIELADSVTATTAGNVWSQVRDRLEAAAARMPPGASTPQLLDQDQEAYTMILALTWNLESPECPLSQTDSRPQVGSRSQAPAWEREVSGALDGGDGRSNILRRLAEELETIVRSVPGTEYTRLAGAGREEILVEINTATLASLGLTAAQVAEIVAQADAKVSAGQLRTAGENLIIEVAGELDSLERIAMVPLAYGPSGEVVRLCDVARVTRGVADPPGQLALVDGLPAVLVAARMAPGERIDLWSEQVREQVEQYRAGLPGGVGLSVIFDQAPYTHDRLASVAKNVLVGMALVAVVVLFTMGWRSALVVGAALPLTSLMVLAGLQAWGVPIHQISVTGLVVALGLLIDGAIVMVNVLRHRLAQGDEPAQAVARSVKTLAVPLLASTVTTVLAFMPLVLMPGASGEFVGPLGISVSLALAFSMLLALTVIPALAVRMQRGSGGSGRWWESGFSSAPLTRAYRRVLDFLFGRPVLGLVLASVLPVAGFLSILGLELQFFPPAERDQFQIQLRLPPQTSIEQTRRTALTVRELLLEHPEIERVHWMVGDTFPMVYYNMVTGDRSAASFAQAIVEVSSPRVAQRVIHEVQDQLDEAFPEAQPLVLQFEQGPPFEAPVELRIYGTDLDELRRLGEIARHQLAAIPQVVHTRTTLGGGLPQLYLDVDDEQMRLAGLDNVGVAGQLEANLEGVTRGSVLEMTEELPVRVRVSSAARADLDAIHSLELLPSNGAGHRRDAGATDVGATDVAAIGWVPLAAIGRMDLRPQPASIPRRELVRCNTVQAYLTAGVLPSVVLDAFSERLEAAGFEASLPPGYRTQWGGEADERAEAIEQLMSSVPILLALMAATLIISLNSFSSAAVIGVVMALTVGGGLASLWVFDWPFGFMAIIGTMGLLGVAINDSIVVIAELAADPRARSGDPEAVREVVVHATRHVLSTTVTTIAGFVPLILAGGGFWPPLAVAIAGGLVTTQLLALVFTPSAYILLTRRRKVSHEL